MPVRKAQLTAEEIRTQTLSSLALIFNEAQTHSSNHTKNYVALHKAHLKLASYTVETRAGSFKNTGEAKFLQQFKLLLAKVLCVKKGDPAADRTIKFVGGYIKHLNEKASEENSQNENDEDDDDEGTTASRFTERVLKFLMGGFSAKDKNVRCRVLHTLSEMIAHLGEIDPYVYDELRASFIDRVNDRELTVRSYAVTCLAKLWKFEDPAATREGESILDILMESMAYDPSPDVRRTVLQNIPCNERTLSAILDRSRDTDTALRKLLYSGVLVKNILAGDETESKTIGSTHPRTLTVAQRELVVENGLGDREPSVKVAAASLIAKWTKMVGSEIEEEHTKQEDGAEEESLEIGVLSLLKLFDLKEKPKTAMDALVSIFQTKKVLFNDIKFGDSYWEHLTPEKAFLARVYAEHCKNTQDDTRLEDTLPVVTTIAFRIHMAYKLMIEGLKLTAAENATMSQELKAAESERREDERISRELVMSELLSLAVNLDYSDETGRRKTFQLVREMLRSEVLPEALISPCLDVLRELSNGEHDLIRIVVETMQELRDEVNGSTEDEIPEEDADASFEMTQEPVRPPARPVEAMSPEQIILVNQMDSKCLSICIAMLERVNSTFEENSTLDGVLKGLILPSMNKADEVLKEKALKSLGLCCLIARKLAIRFLPFFINHIPIAAPRIKIILIQSLFDIFMAHENTLFKGHANNLEVTAKFLLTQIIEEQDPKTKAVLCMGTAKLVLSGMITDIDVLKTLLKAHISPLTSGNQELRQSLAFFFSMYSHSSASNQQRMREIFILIFLDVCEDRKAAKEEDDDTDHISSVQIAHMFVDWTDPLQLSKATNARGAQNESNSCIQMDMAEDILKLLFEKDLKVEIEKEDKRVLCQLLNKLHVPDTVDDYRIRSLKLLMDNLRMRRPFRDSVCRAAFSKFETTIVKKFQKQLEHSSEEEYRKLEQLTDLFEFLDSIIPLDDDEVVLLDEPRRGRKRRSDSITTVTTDSRSGSPLNKGKGKAKAKRPRLSTTSNDNETTEGATSTRTTPNLDGRSRTRPKRAAAAIATKKNDQIIVISSDSEEYTDNPAPKRKTRGRLRSPIKEEEAQVDQDLDDLLADNSSDSSEVPYDSIMDPSTMAPDSEEEEDEVTDLLAEF